VTQTLGQLGWLTTLGQSPLFDGAPLPAGPALAGLIVALPLLGAILCGVYAAVGVKSKLPAFTTVFLIACAFLATLSVYSGFDPAAAKAAGGVGVAAQKVHLFDWIHFQWDVRQTFIANFSLYLDTLTLLWMLFVTGLATLIALYASEYMEHDRGTGYCRFFAAFNLFVFSMACLVMADNLVLLYLGWEGVGLCSYLLIGYFYQRPAAVAAAKKAFIMNRIGDLGLALGIMLTFVQFGSVEYATVFQKLQPYLELAKQGQFDQIPGSVQAIALLIMVGCFGKSAQLPLYVWLPDAMEGPTPVSALIHAATMVTAGVFLMARTLPLFAVSEHAMTIVAWVGCLTALVSATIGMAQFDIKRIMAYSTVSQLGYMFVGLAVLMPGVSDASAGAAGPFHVFTHAFFKALLFLSCGAVMHGFAGQLDLRKLSGLMWMPGWKIVSLGMLVGCLNLAGFPFTAGYFSKDMILAEAFVNPHTHAIGWLMLLTAGLTAYYTFRVFFRVFLGPVDYTMGEEHHGGHDDHDHGHGHDAHGHDHGHDHGHAKAHDAGAAHADHGHGHAHEPHAPKWAINTVLALLAVGSILAAVAYPMKWVPGLIEHSSTALALASAHGGEAAGHAAAGGGGGGVGHGAEHGTFLGFDPHKVMYYVSAVIGFAGIAVAFVLHKAGRTSAATSRAGGLLPLLGPIPGWAQNKWYVDELYNAVVRLPLLVASHLFHLIDKLFIDGLVDTFGGAPRAAGWSLRPAQSGVLNGYALGMAVGIGLISLLVMMLMF
jgi:NADH-quinone oxidoreductase subunit L